jgi:nucleoside-diphosphate-sugar epimerase
MKALVTGSAGFIGRFVVRELRARGWVVTGLDRAPTERDRAGEYVCDLLDAPRLADCLREFSPDALVHLAARTDLDERRDLDGYADNIDGVKNLVAAVEATPSIKRAIWTSSQLVCRVGYVPRDETDYCADTLYGHSKVLTERIVRKHDGGAREWCLVRPTTVWGPGMSVHYRRFLGMIARGRYFHVGWEPLFKSYGYVGNLAYQYGRLLEAPASQMNRKTLYLADYQPTDLQAWCDAFQRGFESRPIPHLPRALAKVLAIGGDLANAVGFRRFPFNSFRLNNVLTQYRFDLEPTRALCGELPYTMEQGVAETVAWFRSLAPA